MKNCITWIIKEILVDNSEEKKCYLALGKCSIEVKFAKYKQINFKAIVVVRKAKVWAFKGCSPNSILKKENWMTKRRQEKTEDIDIEERIKD